MAASLDARAARQTGLHDNSTNHPDTFGRVLPTDDNRSPRVNELIAAVTAETGVVPFNDAVLAAFNDGTAVVVDHGAVVGLARLDDSEATIQVAVDPAAPAESSESGVEAVVAELIARVGDVPITWWVFTTALPSSVAASIADRAAALGFTAQRSVLQLRRSLPADDTASIVTRSFTPDDTAAWLDVNNRAFRGHGEQGDWTAEQLEQRVRQPWFDAAGFRLHERDGRLAGFCWTKAHHYEQPPSGEIYVIGVDPDFQGLGLGRQLTLAGLDSMVAAGLTAAQLYVDADNKPARHLYDSLGFAAARRDDAYRRVG